jgi:glycosyltransferase involved in cell wall biosynthesis
MSLRIAMLTTFYPPYSFGGDAIGVQRLARALAGLGCEITVIHDRDAFETLSTARPAQPPPEPRIEIVGLKSRFGTAANLLTHQSGRPLVHGRRIRSILRDGNFDVIWYNNVSLLGGPGVLTYGTGIKIYEAHEHWLVCPTHVLWRHGRELCDARECLRCVFAYRRPPQLWRSLGMLERNLSHVDAFIAKSEFSRDIHYRFGFRRDMHVVPYFLPDEAMPDPGASPRNAPYFLFVGRLEEIKGVQDVLPAFTGESGPELVIVGSGDFEPELRRLASGMPRVVFTGRLPPEQITAYYRNAIALIVPSICYETFGIILIESARSGTPVIARNIGPFPEILKRGGGVLFNNTTDLTSSMEMLATDATRRNQIAREGRLAFESHWRQDVVVKAYLDVVREAAANRADARVLTLLKGLA